MSRRREFDPTLALERAKQAFRRHGYAAASVDTLTRAMGIGRQSAYDTFGDKHALFLRALSSWGDGIVAHLGARLDAAPRPLEEIAAFLREVAQVAREPEGRHGCLITNTATELGASDPEAHAIVVRTWARIEETFHRALCRARNAGRLSAGRSPRALARFLLATMQGLRVMGSGEASPAVLRDVVRTAVTALER